MRGFGGPEVLALGTVPVPEPGPDDVQVAVALAAVNFADINARFGTYVDRKRAPVPSGLGLEFLGAITATGANVTNLSVGTRAAGFAASPAYAEYAVTPAELVWPVPEAVGDEAAASVNIVGHTTYHLLTTVGRLERGDNVLVTAAAGGVGATLVQVARLLGAGSIVAAAGSAARVELAVGLGADIGVDYSAGGLSDQLRARSPRAMDLVLDGVGGAVRRSAFDCIAPFGRLVHFGNSSRTPEELPAPREMRERGIGVAGFHLQQLRSDRRDLLARSADALFGWLADGTLTIPVSDVLPLDRSAEAHRMLESRTVQGKLLLRVSEDVL